MAEERYRQARRPRLPRTEDLALHATFHTYYLAFFCHPRRRISPVACIYSRTSFAFPRTYIIVYPRAPPTIVHGTISRPSLYSHLTTPPTISSRRVLYHIVIIEHWSRSQCHYMVPSSSAAHSTRDVVNIEMMRVITQVYLVKAFKLCNGVYVSRLHGIVGVLVYPWHADGSKQ